MYEEVLDQAPPEVSAYEIYRSLCMNSMYKEKVLWMQLK